MAILAQDKSSGMTKFPLPEAGTTRAVCCAVWDLGLQKTVYNGEEKIQHKVIIAWEIDEKINCPDSEFHGQPYMLSKKYTLSLSDKATLRKDLESWRGKPYTAEEVKVGIDLERLYGVNCFIGISHEAAKNDPSKIYANVTAILPLAKGMEKIAPVRAVDAAPPNWVIEKQQAAVITHDGDPYPEKSKEELLREMGF